MNTSEFIDIKINRKILSKALSNIKPIISGKHTLAILSHIFISVKNGNTIEIIATNLETWFRGRYPIPETITTGNNLVIEHKKLSNFVMKSKAENIHIMEKEKRWISLSDSDNSIISNIVCMNADTFPDLPKEIDCKKTIEIGESSLKDIISKAIIINPRNVNEARKPYIIGSLFKTIKKGKQNFLQMTSTNEGVLVKSNEKINGLIKEDKTALIPKSGLKRLKASFLGKIKKDAQRKNKRFERLFLTPNNESSIFLGIEDDFFIAQKQNETIIIRLLEGDFPDCKNLITRKNKNIITADRKVLLNAMKQMATMEDDNYHAMALNISTNILKMIFVNPDIGEMKKDIEAKYTGKSIEIGICPSQFVNFLNLMKGDIVNINIDIMGNECPYLITEEKNKETLFLIMPWQIKNY